MMGVECLSCMQLHRGVSV